MGIAIAKRANKIMRMTTERERVSTIDERELNLLKYCQRRLFRVAICSRIIP